jgi:hypothetical protein
MPTAATATIECDICHAATPTNKVKWIHPVTKRLSWDDKASLALCDSCGTHKEDS